MKFTWFYRWQCRRGVHQDVLLLIGHSPYKHCEHCRRPGILTPAEVAELRSRWLVWLPTSGEDNEGSVEAKEG